MAQSSKSSPFLQHQHAGKRSGLKTLGDPGVGHFSVDAKRPKKAGKKQYKR